MTKSETDESPTKAPTRSLRVVDRWIIVLVSGLIGVPFIIDYYYRAGATGNPGIELALYLFFLLIYVYPTVIALRSSGLHGFLKYCFGLTAVPLFIAIFIACVHLLFGEIPALGQEFSRAQVSGDRQTEKGIALIAVVPAAIIFSLWYKFLAIINRFARIDRKLDFQASAQSRKHALGWFVAICAVVAAAIAAFYAYAPGPRAQWMTSVQYQRDFDARAPKGFYPREVEGRCEAGSEKYLPDWRPLPRGAAFFHYFGMTREGYDSRNRDYLARGFSLVSAKHFTDCSGVKRYQATWLRR